VGERRARLAAPVVPAPAGFCTMTPRRHPAWMWYALAAAGILVLVVLDVTGVLGGLGP
jgi:hypothetical protein